MLGLRLRRGLTPRMVLVVIACVLGLTAVVGRAAPAHGASGRLPEVRSSEIPPGSVAFALAVLVLTVVGIGVVRARRRRSVSPGSRDRTHRTPTRFLWPLSDAPTDTVAASRGSDRSAADRMNAGTLEFLLDLGVALIDAGDAVNHVGSSLRRIGRANGAEDVSVVVLPTSIMMSITAGPTLFTEVTAAGRDSLRLDQTDRLLRLVAAAEDGQVSPEQGRANLERIRTMPPVYSLPTRLAGYVLSAAGLAMVLRGGVVETLLAGALGALVGFFLISTEGAKPTFAAFRPLLAAFGSTTGVFVVGRVVDDLATLPPVAGPLITLLPGALLTMGVIELATNQIVSGTARLASGALRLVMLAIGIIGAAALVGLPASTGGTASTGALATIAPWIGVAVFGLGTVWFNGAARAATPWIMIVLYVAYAGQVVGGLFFGSELSAFFGAFLMTPVAVIAARQERGPSTLVTFMPAFWLLVPGSLGLEGVTRVLGDQGAEGVANLVTTTTSIVAIALGILLGLVVGSIRTRSGDEVDPIAATPSGADPG